MSNETRHIDLKIQTVLETVIKYYKLLVNLCYEQLY